jgi:hypothetical protein
MLEYVLEVNDLMRRKRKYCPARRYFPGNLNNQPVAGRYFHSLFNGHALTIRHVAGFTKERKAAAAAGKNNRNKL